MGKFAGKNLFIFFVSLAGVFFIFPAVSARTVDAPTLIEPAEGAVVNEAKPLIKGLAPSGVVAHIYIDGVYSGKTDYLNDESGTANFAYSPYVELDSGSHRVWAVAEKQDGSKSGPSNILNFKVELPAPARTVKEKTVEKKELSAAVSPDNDTAGIEEPNEINKEAIETAKKELTKEEESAGLVDENNEKQSRISSNIVVFVLFLIGIIAWILWVNKELIKERKKRKENDN